MGSSVLSWDLFGRVRRVQSGTSFRTHAGRSPTAFHKRAYRTKFWCRTTSRLSSCRRSTLKSVWVRKGRIRPHGTRVHIDAGHNWVPSSKAPDTSAWSACLCDKVRAGSTCHRSTAPAHWYYKADKHLDGKECRSYHACSPYSFACHSTPRNCEAEAKDHNMVHYIFHSSNCRQAFCSQHIWSCNSDMSSCRKPAIFSLIASLQNRPPDCQNFPIHRNLLASNLLILHYLRSAQLVACWAY